MIALNIIMSLTLLYYAFLISYTLCRLLTPKKCFRHPGISCFLLMASAIPAIWLYDTLISISIPLCLFLCLLVFEGQWKVRIASATIAYLILVLVETLAINLSSALISLITGKLVIINRETQSVPYRIFTYLCLIVTGLLLMNFFVSIIKQHFLMARPKILILLGLPLFLINMSPYPLFLFRDSPYYNAVIVLLILFYLLMYIPLSAGFQQLHDQELHRRQKEQQYKLMQRQLSFSQEIEKEYQEIRKWNHDISNHFISITYYMENQKYEEAKKYLEKLIERAET